MYAQLCQESPFTFAFLLSLPACVSPKEPSCTEQTQPKINGNSTDKNVNSRIIITVEFTAVLLYIAKPQETDHISVK